MYIIIHKYQRWSVNETKQKYLKNMSKEKQKKTQRIKKWFKGDLKPV